LGNAEHQRSVEDEALGNTDLDIKKCALQDQHHTKHQLPSKMEVPMVGQTLQDDQHHTKPRWYNIHDGDSEDATEVNAVLSKVSKVTLDKWIEDNNLDEKCGKVLRSLSSTIQEAVQEMGGCAHCRNPSAAVMSRIRKIERQHAFVPDLQAETEPEGAADHYAEAQEEALEADHYNEAKYVADDEKHVAEHGPWEEDWQEDWQEDCQQDCQENWQDGWAEDADEGGAWQ